VAQSRNASAGECGDEDQVGRVGVCHQRAHDSRVNQLIQEVPVEVVVKGRHCEVSDRYRSHVEEKLVRLEKYDQRIIRVDVVVSEEPNSKLADQAVRVEITIMSKGPVVRSEASGPDKMSALDKAVDRLSAQKRKAADRRRIHHGTRTPTSLGQAMAAVESAADDRSHDGTEDLDGEHKVGPLTVTGDGPLVVREKSHAAVPMTLDQALFEMELVGHDFYLFIDKANDVPAVVYRRKGYDYGVIRLLD